MMTGVQTPFHDIETSNIGGLLSEVGWAFADPASGELHSESHLIKFPANREIDPVWEADAEKLHEICRKQLIAHGQSPMEIVVRMNNALAGQRLYSDARHFAQLWHIIARGLYARG